MYLCSGNEDWVDTIDNEKYFEVTQLFKLSAGLMCNKGRDRYETMGLNLKKFMRWLKGKDKEELQMISQCVTEEVAVSFKLLSCCGQSSENLFGAFMRVLELFFCSNQKYSTRESCSFMSLLVESDIQEQIFTIIEISKICINSCPIQTSQSKQLDNVVRKVTPGVQKRQFDMSTTLNYFKRSLCEDLNKIFTVYTWEKTFTRDWEIVNVQTERFFVFVAIMRKPICCILQNRWS
ncbi:hypothetical protein ACHWQZ_G002782 [Mnemiopsis leidyi]